MPLVKVSISNDGNHGKEVVPSDQWDHLRSNACCNLNMHPLFPW